MAEYLICLDFEATCYPSKSQRNKGWYAEIVDIGAVLMRLYDGHIETDFQCNVQPTEFYLTRGCSKKLNMCQHYLDNCPTLTTVLNRYGHSDDENTYFCMWSNMDLNYFLPNECKQKNICYANYLKYWINGQEIFNDIYGWNAKLHDAADYLGTCAVGNAHDAIDDAKTLAFLVHDMWENQNVTFNVKNCR